MFDKYEMKLTLIRDMLGTNPCDPNVMDTHIINKQRELITEKKNVNSEINKYLNQLEISKGKSDAEINSILDKMETMMGVTLTEDEREAAVKGELESLKVTFGELDIKGTTIFFWDAKKKLPMIGDHMIYGFMKAASEAIGRTLPKKNATPLQSISYTQSLINQHVRCDEQFIHFDKDIKRREDGHPDYFQRSLRAMTAQGPRVTLAKSEVVEAGARLHFVLKVLQGSPLNQDVIQKLFSYGELVGLGQWRSSGRGMFNFEMMRK